MTIAVIVALTAVVIRVVIIAVTAVVIRLVFKWDCRHNGVMGLVKTLRHLFHPHRSNNHRARVLHPEVLGIFSLLLLAVFTSVSAINQAPGRLGTILGYASNISVEDVIAQTNRERQAAGLKTVSNNSKLAVAAAAKAQDMFAKQYWAHVSPEGTQPWKFINDSGYSYQIAGENLARDFSVTNEMMAAWMSSPTHRANIMNDKYTEIGIAVVNGTLEGSETTLVVQMFGSPRLVAAAPPKVTAVAAQAPSVVKSAPVNTLPPTPVASANPVASPVVGKAPSVAPTRELLPNVEADQAAPVAENSETSLLPSPMVLASALIPQGSLTLPPLFTPLQILKAVFLATIMMIVFTLIYDSLIIGHRQTLRMVGHNLSHVLLLVIVAYLLISFKAGILG